MGDKERAKMGTMMNKWTKMQLKMTLSSIMSSTLFLSYKSIIANVETKYIQVAPLVALYKFIHFMAESANPHAIIRTLIILTYLH